MNTILLVEDKADNRLVIEDIFEFDDIGAELAVATTGEAALEMARALRPILILMDLGLPDMPGTEATVRLKAAPETASIPVWAITAHAMRDIRKKAFEAGCEDYVTKPIDADTLTTRLREFTRARGEGA